jgi:tetratricopeptide (TPR) repeat protein
MDIIGRKLILLLLAVLIILLAFWQQLVIYWDRNIAALDTMRSLQTDDPIMVDYTKQNLTALRNENKCPGAWFLGLVYNSLGDLVQRDQSWETALACSPIYIQLVRAKVPEELNLAEFAVQVQPEQAEAWFWLAKLEAKDKPDQAIQAYWKGLKLQPYQKDAWVQLSGILASLDIQDAMNIYEQFNLDQVVTNDPVLRSEPKFMMASILSGNQPERAIQLYRQGLQDNPSDGVRWYQLGDLLAKGDPKAGLEAYLQSCYHGDPGAHGCYGAGLMAEKLGDIPSAIRYYRLSKWQDALQRAIQLEQMSP